MAEPTLQVLEKPDVRVFQEFGPEAPSLIRPLLEAAMVGQCFQIEEKAVAGQYFGSATTYGYPNLKTGAIVQIPEVEVFIQQASDEFDVTDQIVPAGGAISATGVDLPAGFLPEKRVVAQRQVSTFSGTTLRDDNTDFVTAGIRPGDLVNFVTAAGDLEQPDSNPSAQAGDFIVLNVLSENELEVTPALVDETRVEYFVKRVGTASGDVSISYRALRTDLVGQLVESQTSEEADQQLGLNVPENPLRFAVGIALLHTDSVVAAVAVENDSLADFTEAAEFLESKEIYGIVPLTFNPTVHQMFKQHVDQMSRPENKKERIVLFTPEIKDKIVFQALSATGSTTAGADVFTDAGALFVTNGVPIGAVLKFSSPQGFGGNPVTEIVIKSVLNENQVEVIATADATSSSISYTVETRPFTKLQQALNLQGIGQGFQDRRVVMGVPDIAETTQDSTEVDIPGYFLNAAISGLISGSSPSQGFTNFPIAGFTGLKRSNFYFNETQLGVIAAGGGFIYIQETLQSPVTIRHQVTTDVTSIQRRELSIVKAVDFMAKFLRNRIRRLIGINNITDNFLNNILRPQVNGIIEDLVEDRIIGRNTKITRLVQDAAQPDTVKVDITLEVLFPANFIDFTLII